MTHLTLVLFTPITIKFNNAVSNFRWFDLVKNTGPDYEEANGKGVRVYKEIIENFRLKK